MTIRYNINGDKMSEQNKLTMQMAIFFLIVFVSFGTLVVKEKQNILFKPKIENSINEYVYNNYNDLDINKSEVKIIDNKFVMKVMNKTNKNLYFYVTYSKKKITDTYQKDYVEGNSIIPYLNKQIENKIKNIYNINSKVKIINTLDTYSSQIKKRLLKEDKIENLKIYNLELEISSIWNNEEITNKISNIMTNLEQKKITPNNYTIIVTNPTDITQSVKINNLTTKCLENNNLTIIINDIINNNNTDILKTYNITYEYLN